MDADFIKGFALCAAFIASDHNSPEVAADALNCNGISWNDLVKGGTDQYDLNRLKDTKKMLNKRGD